MCNYCAPEHLILICVLYVEVYIIGKAWCEYDSNQITDYAVNLELIMSKTSASLSQLPPIFSSLLHTGPANPTFL